MFDQMFEDFHKASESSLHMQQEVFKNLAQQWLSPTFLGVSAERSRAMQKQWMELAIEMLHKHRESLEATYKSGIQVIEQTFHVSEAKSPEEYRRLVEGLWRQLLDIFKNHSETQLREFQNWAEKSFESARKATVSSQTQPPPQGAS
jgi:hypothetical protein